MNEYLVVGIEYRTSKKGESYHMVHLSQAFSDSKYGTGSRTSVEYISNKIYPANLKVGDTIELVFNRGFDGKAYISDARVVEIPTIKNNK